MKSGLLLFVACLLLLLSGCTGDPPTVWLELTPIGQVSHQVYVDVMLTFHNDSDEEIAIYCWSHNRSVAESMNSFLFFDIERSDGTDLIFKPGCAGPIMPRIKDRKIIEPGGKYAEKINIARFYVDPDRAGKDIEQPWQRWLLRIWDQGEYEVQCVYEYMRNPDRTGGEGLWEGKLTSNEVTLKIGPSGIPWGVFKPPSGWNADSVSQ